MACARMLRNKKGAAVAELPLLLFVVFIVVALPLIGLATLAYRDAFFSWSVKDSCSKAAKSVSFTAAAALARSAIAQDCRSFSGIKITHCRTAIICRNLSTGAETESTTVLDPATINTHDNLYFFKLDVGGVINPLIQLNGCLPFCSSIPGLTAPYPVEGACELFFERPFGLST